LFRAFPTPTVCFSSDPDSSSLVCALLSFRKAANRAVFVSTDVICILVQLAGGALFGVSAGNDPGEGGIDVDTATNVLLAGLVLQVSVLVDINMDQD